MRKILFLFLLVSFCSSATSQIVKGRIFDQKSGSPIGFASVYFNGTLVGTLTNQSGYFELDISKYLSMPLTISALGYYSVTLTNYSPDKALSIYLTSKVFELKEVIVSAKAYAKARRINIKIFKTQFLGQTLNALKCEITNINDIKLIYDSDNETLKAFSSKPILINNDALGYKITYYLDKFEYCKTNQSLMLTGNYIFNEYLTTNKKQNERFEKRRRSAYIESRMHFFRTLWHNELDSSGFSVMTSSGARLYTKNLVIQTDSITKYLKYRGNLHITYFKKWDGSDITMIKEYVYFDKNGYFDPMGISWRGEMTKQRIADLLPYDYLFNKTLR